MRSGHTDDWYGLLAPAATRASIIECFPQQRRKRCLRPILRERMLNDGAEPERSSPVEFQKHLSEEIAKWRKVVKTAG